MNPGLSLTFHVWRGFGGDRQRDLFIWRWRLGFVTIAIERTDVLVSYRRLRVTIERAVERADEEVR